MTESEWINAYEATPGDYLDAGDRRFRLTEDGQWLIELLGTWQKAKSGGVPGRLRRYVTPAESAEIPSHEEWQKKLSQITEGFARITDVFEQVLLVGQGMRIKMVEAGYSDALAEQVSAQQISAMQAAIITSALSGAKKGN